MHEDLSILKRLSILLVEDNAIMRKEVSDMLRLFFRDVFIAENGESAFCCYEDEKPDIVLSDIKMPLMDGVTLARKIRQNDFETPIVLLSSYSDQNTLLSSLNTGVNGYLLKPLNLSDMLSLFTKLSKQIILKDPVVTVCNGLLYNMLSEELYKEGEMIHLGKKEKSLLKLFLKHKDSTLSKEEIISSIWPLEEISDSAFKNLLNRLRSKVGFELIVSVKGSGWRLNNWESK